MNRFKVLVVDDSIFMRKSISDLISADPLFHIVGTANNGKEAIDQVRLLKPDVITLDIEMPIMNGLQALEIIMKEFPTPVVMLSSLTAEGAKETIHALELGAVDFVRKPSGSISMDIHKENRLLIEKLKIAVVSRVKTIQPAQYQVMIKSVLPKSTIYKDADRFAIHQLVAIGTSTGGPKALQEVLTNLPEDFCAPLLIVQHMPPNFTKTLAQRLDTLSKIRVMEAEDGLQIENGTAYIAPGGMHMRVYKSHALEYRIKLSKEETVNGHRPSVDVLFHSLVSLKELKRHVILMTGMGRDGAQGMKDMRDSGAVTTIAESQETCIVYGMPRSAVELQCVTHILPLNDISQKLTKTVMNLH